MKSFITVIVNLAILMEMTSLAHAKPELQKIQQRIEGDYRRWIKDVENFIERSETQHLTSQDIEIIEKLRNTLEKARTLRITENMTLAQLQLSLCDYRKALPPETDVTLKLKSLLYKPSTNSSAPHNNSKQSTQGEEPINWEKLDPDSSSASESHPTKPGDPASPDGQKGPANLRPIAREEIPSGEWAKLPPRQLERLVETRLDTLPTEYGWRESVKQYFMKLREKRLKK